MSTEIVKALSAKAGQELEAVFKFNFDVRLVTTDATEEVGIWCLIDGGITSIPEGTVYGSYGLFPDEQGRLQDVKSVALVESNILTFELDELLKLEVLGYITFIKRPSQQKA